ncbi:RDD family protein [Cellulomonas sp. URHE0023]|uniref:RDD family protein n=1 Tax=Cellulomonas sp. URHE0023 TaxID=1380354 RepID=UPI00047F8FE2|nr:RDD family protein [Cellulomonas sp. URHE0023]
MADRRDLSSWLEGEPAGRDPAGGRGHRLGLSPEGPGSLGRLGRRVGALLIDWFACLAISAAFFPVTSQGFYLTRGSSLATLGVFALENVLLVGSIGNTLGHRLMGLRVRRVFAAQSDAAKDPVWETAAPGFLSALTRTLLLCLVVPAVIWDADGRGLHDRVAGTAIVRR